MDNKDVEQIGEAISAGFDKGLQEGLQFKPKYPWEYRPVDSTFSEEEWNATMIRIREIFAEVDAMYAASNLR